MELSGLSALVTGAGHRIGAAIAIALGRAGVNVVVHYGSSREPALTTCRELESLGVKSRPLAADLSQPQEAIQLLPRAVAALGRPLEILVNSAAIFHPGGIRNTPWEQWQAHLAVNLTAPFLLLQGFAAQLPAGSRGKVVNILDRRVTRPPAGHVAYTAAKSALWSLTRMAAIELAPAIQVNGIGPGPILPAPGDSLERFQAIGAATPLGRPGSTTDITDAVLFFLRHDYITGELLCVDGGEHL